MHLTQRNRTLVVGLLTCAATLAVSAQGPLTPEQARARLEVGAAFLKSGDTELATKTFAAVVDADPANWQARSLLALAYLSARDLGKVDIELNRLKTQKAPAQAVPGQDRSGQKIELAGMGCLAHREESRLGSPPRAARSVSGQSPGALKEGSLGMKHCAQAARGATDPS
jgi:hypothetical protein